MAHDRVEAVERALTVLAAFDPEVRALSLAELAAATGFYKSTILRLARSLERFGFLIRAPHGSFRLGPELWRLGSLYRRDHDLGEYVRPALRRLRDQSAESASFYIRDGDRRVCNSGEEHVDVAVVVIIADCCSLSVHRNIQSRSGCHILEMTTAVVLVQS